MDKATTHRYVNTIMYWAFLMCALYIVFVYGPELDCCSRVCCMCPDISVTPNFTQPLNISIGSIISNTIG